MEFGVWNFRLAAAPGISALRLLSAVLLLLAAAGSGCRQAPNPFLFGSLNTTRLVDDSACASWAEPLPIAGLPNLHRVSAGLYRGAQPNPEGFLELQKLGIKTVINLRESHGLDTRLSELGFAYEHIPMTAFAVKDADVVRFLQIAGDPDRAPVFVHCQRGADRTGLMSAVYRIAVEGWTKEQALAEMTQGGFRFNHGFQNIVNYIRDVDVELIKRRTGLAPEPAGSH